MWLRKLQHVGGATMLTVPHEVAQAWAQQGVRYVEVLYTGPGELTVKALLVSPGPGAGAGTEERRTHAAVDPGD